MPEAARCTPGVCQAYAGVVSGLWGAGGQEDLLSAEGRVRFRVGSNARLQKEDLLSAEERVRLGWVVQLSGLCNRAALLYPRSAAGGYRDELLQVLFWS